MTNKEIIKKAKALFKDHKWIKFIYADGDYAVFNALYKVEFDRNHDDRLVVDIVPTVNPYA